MAARELFGGAVTASIPERLVDISDFRPVPDHQEVFADGDTDQSLIVEIMERANTADEGCGAFFFLDLASQAEASAHEMGAAVLLGAADMPGVPADSFKCLVAGKMWVSKGREGTEASNAVHALLAIVRLPQVQSDLLLTLNTPLYISSASAAAAQAGSGGKSQHLQAPQLMQQVLSSLRIVDWGLFG